MRWLALAVAVVPALAWADGGLLSSRGRLPERTRVELFGGPRGVGLGYTRTDRDAREAAAAGDPHAGFAAEVTWQFAERVSELRLARVWQLTRTRAGTLSATVGATGVVVPDVRFDLGAGPQAALALGLGSARVQLDLALQAGAEFFLRAGLGRVPLRAQAALGVTFGPVVVSLLARTGADLFTRGPFAFRAEAALAVGWVGG